jgi:hypothetical protein
MTEINFELLVTRTFPLFETLPGSKKSNPAARVFQMLFISSSFYFYVLYLLITVASVSAPVLSAGSEIFFPSLSSESSLKLESVEESSTLPVLDSCFDFSSSILDKIHYII